MPLKDLPGCFNHVKPLLLKYDQEVQNRHSTLLAAALAFVLRQPDIDCMIIGVNNRNHLREILSIIPDIDKLADFDYSPYALLDESVINPSLWKRQ